MSRGLEIPKASPESAAVGIFDGLANGEDEIFPDPASASIAEEASTSSCQASVSGSGLHTAPARTATISPAE